MQTFEIFDKKERATDENIKKLIIARLYEKDILGNVCFSKPAEDFASVPLCRHLRFELFFQKYQKLKTVCLDKFAIINKIKKKCREYVRIFT